MITLLAFADGEESDEFGPFVCVEFKDGGLRGEIDAGEFIDFCFHEGRWYPRSFSAVMDGENLVTVDDGTKTPGRKRVYVGPELSHHGWDILLITEIEKDEDEFFEPDDAVETDGDLDDN